MKSLKKSFTLIELLVVIAIIAILASMLLPALNSARDKAKLAACISNLKQQYTALATYGSDFADYLPGRPYSLVASQRLGSNNEGESYLFYANKYLGIETENCNGDTPWDHARKRLKADVLFCPSVPFDVPRLMSEGVYDGNGSRGAISYAVALGTGQEESDQQPVSYFRFSNLSKGPVPASRKMLIADRLYEVENKWSRALMAHGNRQGNVLTAAGNVASENRAVFKGNGWGEGLAVPSNLYYVYIGKPSWNSVGWGWLEAPGGIWKDRSTRSECPFF